MFQIKMVYIGKSVISISSLVKHLIFCISLKICGKNPNVFDSNEKCIYRPVAILRTFKRTQTLIHFIPRLNTFNK